MTSAIMIKQTSFTNKFAETFTKITKLLIINQNYVLCIVRKNNIYSHSLIINKILTIIK